MRAIIHCTGSGGGAFATSASQDRKLHKEYCAEQTDKPQPYSVVTALVPDTMQCTPQVEELLHPFGLLKAFNLVMDKHTGNSKARSLLAASAHPPPMWSVCMHPWPSE